MKKIMGIIILIVLIVAVSGCAVGNTSNATYSANGITFNYPSDFKEETFSGDIVPGSDWETVGFLSNGDIYIGIYKNPTQNDPELVRNETVLTQFSGGDNLGSTQSTNSHGVEMFENIATINDPSTNQTLRYYNAFFLVSGEVFQISVYGKNGNVEIEIISDRVFESLALT